MVYIEIAMTDLAPGYVIKMRVGVVPWPRHPATKDGSGRISFCLLFGGKNSSVSKLGSYATYNTIQKRRPNGIIDKDWVEELDLRPKGTLA